MVWYIRANCYVCMFNGRAIEAFDSTEHSIRLQLSSTAACLNPWREKIWNIIKCTMDKRAAGQHQQQYRGKITTKAATISNQNGPGAHKK